MIYSFGEFELDTRRCELRRARQPQHLEPQVYAVLCHLVENRERLVTREDLLDHVWGHRFITPATLNTRIKVLRKALGDDGSAQGVIKTVRGRGFRFVAPVEAREGERADAGRDRGGSTGAARAAGAPSRTTATASGPEQQIRFCRAPDRVRIAYATSGSGPPLVKTANWLTHLEYDWNSPVWRHWMTALSREHTLVRYDERGCGLSDWDMPETSFEAWLRDLESVVDDLGLERFPLLGLSQGAAVAVAYAACHPDRVSRIVLYGGYARGRLRRDPSPQARQEIETLENLLALGWGHDNPAFRQVFATLFMPEATPAQMEWFTDLQRVSTSAENALKIERTSYDIDVRDLAPRVTAPTLILHAHDDAMIPFDQGRELAALIPDARFVPLESRNHILRESEPAWTHFLDETRSFLGAEAVSLPIGLERSFPIPRR